MISGWSTSVSDATCVFTLRLEDGSEHNLDVVEGTREPRLLQGFFRDATRQVQLRSFLAQTTSLGTNLLDPIFKLVPYLELRIWSCGDQAFVFDSDSFVPVRIVNRESSIQNPCFQLYRVKAEKFKLRNDLFPTFKLLTLKDMESVRLGNGVSKVDVEEVAVPESSSGLEPNSVSIPPEESEVAVDVEMVSSHHKNDRDAVSESSKNQLEEDVQMLIASEDFSMEKLSSSVLDRHIPSVVLSSNVCRIVDWNESSIPVTFQVEISGGTVETISIKDIDFRALEAALFQFFREKHQQSRLRRLLNGPKMEALDTKSYGIVSQLRVFVRVPNWLPGQKAVLYYNGNPIIVQILHVLEDSPSKNDRSLVRLEVQFLQKPRKRKSCLARTLLEVDDFFEPGETEANAAETRNNLDSDISPANAAEANEASPLYSTWTSKLDLLYTSYMAFDSDSEIRACCWLESVSATNSRRKRQQIYVPGSVSSSQGRVPTLDLVDVALCSFPDTQTDLKDYLLGKPKRKKIPYASRHVYSSHVLSMKQCKQVPSVLALRTWRSDVHVVHSESLSFDENEQKEKIIKPNLCLKGLTADKSPVKSLDFCSVEPRVVAGSEDGTFCLWSMEDHSFESFGETCVLPRFYTRLKDFAFQQTAFSPRSCQIVTAVSRQGQQVLWDLRAAEPTSSLQLGHQMNNCAWGSLNEHSILYVGSNAVFLVDLRKSSEQSIVKSFVLAEEALSVEWSPFQESLFAVSGRNGMSLIMDSNAPAEQAIKFHHFSHTGDVHQIHWNPFEAWTLASVSGNTENQTGCVQLWRPNALILMNDEEFETNVIRNL